MLLIDARRGPSAIHGEGLIAREFIAAGTCIWSYLAGFDQEISERDFAALPARARDYLRMYAYFNLGETAFLGYHPARLE